jgi:hypothetical protein
MPGEVATALMVGELYEALKLAQQPPLRSPTSSAGSAGSRPLVSMNTAVLAMNTALVVEVGGRLFQFF